MTVESTSPRASTSAPVSTIAARDPAKHLVTASLADRQKSRQLFLYHRPAAAFIATAAGLDEFQVRRILGRANPVDIVQCGSVAFSDLCRGQTKSAPALFARLIRDRQCFGRPPEDLVDQAAVRLLCVGALAESHRWHARPELQLDLGRRAWRNYVDAITSGQEGDLPGGAA